MGVASAIPYDISVDINHFPDTHSWKLHDGRKKVNMPYHEYVCVLRDE
jgi:hypothetical protein